MKLFLQYGYGMKQYTLDLAKLWNETNVIMSPRDTTAQQCSDWGKLFNDAGCNTYFDPQCFYPDNDVYNLPNYSYWNFANYHSLNKNIKKLLENVKHYNNEINSKIYLLPCNYKSYDDNWCKDYIKFAKMISETSKDVMGDKPRYLTLLMPSIFLLQKDEIYDNFVDSLSKLDIDGFYVLAEAFKSNYLIEEPSWVSNVLYICASLKLSGKKIIYGYGNHQLLPLALANIEAMASGTWVNVRTFNNRFIQDNSPKSRNIWVYHPHALSEYKLEFLDLAYNHGYLSSVFPETADYMGENINKLISSKVSPSSSGFKERDSFIHYLRCLSHQVEVLNTKSYSFTFSTYEMMLNTAESEISRLENLGFIHNERSFKSYIDINRSAIHRLDQKFGFALKMDWNK